MVIREALGAHVGHKFIFKKVLVAKVYILVYLLDGQKTVLKNGTEKWYLKNVPGGQNEKRGRKEVMKATQRGLIVQQGLTV